MAVERPATQLGAEHHLERLPAHRLAQDRGPARREVALVDVELVGIHRALHHHLAQAVRRGDEHHAVEARLGVEREQHARRALVAAHHPLHAGRQRDVRMREALVHAIGDRAVVVERRKYLTYCMEYVVYSTDIKKCFLLAGKRRVGQVLGGGRRPHREGRVRRRPRERVVGGSDFLLERRRAAARPPASRESARRPARARSRPRCRRRAAALRCARARPLVLEELAKRARRGREPARHPDAGAGELADHFAERRVLAADLLDVGHAQSFERDHARLGLSSSQRTSRGRNWCVAGTARAGTAILACRARHAAGALLHRKSAGRRRETKTAASAAVGRSRGADASRGAARPAATSWRPRDRRTCPWCRRPGSRRRPGRAGGGSSPPAAACDRGRDASP